MSLWIICDADGCDARVEVQAWEGRERGDVEVGHNHKATDWYEESTLTHNQHRLDICPKHLPRGARIPMWIEPRRGAD